MARVIDNVSKATLDQFVRQAVSHKVSRKYLPLYVAEFEFRYNNWMNADIFGAAIRAC